MNNLRLAAFALAVGLCTLLLAPLAQAQSRTVTAEMVANDQKSKIQLPVQVDEMTMLSDIAADGNTIVYTMTVSVDIKELESEGAALAQQMQSMCNDPNYQTVLKQGMSIRMVYRDEKGGQLPPLQISPADCKS